MLKQQMGRCVGPASIFTNFWFATVHSPELLNAGQESNHRSEDFWGRKHMQVGHKASGFRLGTSQDRDAVLSCEQPSSKQRPWITPLIVALTRLVRRG